jgi:DHA1 family bicyclomycin/chloramphenicol resistance-like MFS transporter
VLVPVVIAGLTMIGPFSIDTPFPAFPDIQRDLGVGAAGTQQLVSSYLLAFGLMCLFHGPISDAVGRRPVILGGVAVYAVASLGCLLAPSMPVLLACRVLQGLAAGGGVIVGRTLVRDLYDGPDAQRLMGRVMMIFGLAPAVAPIIGGWLLELGSWRVIFAFLVVFAVLAMVATVVVLPETHPVENRTPLRVGALLRNLVRVGGSLGFHRLAWAGAFVFGGYFLYIGAAAIVVVDLLHRGEQDFWMLFVPLIGGMIAGSWANSRAAGRVPLSVTISAGLVVSLLAAVVNVGVASATQALPWVMVGPTLLGAGVGLAYPNLQLAVLDLFPHVRGSAASATTFVSLLLNAVSAGVLAPVLASSLAVMAWTALGYVVVGAVLWVWHLAANAR